MIHGDIDTRGLLASVASITDSPRLEADLMMQRDVSNLVFTFGANAKKVDRIEFTLLADPTRLRWLTSNNPDITITPEPEIGTYHVSVHMHGSDITVGTQIATLTADSDPDTTIALIDTEFESEGQQYSITNKWE